MTSQAAHTPGRLRVDETCVRDEQNGAVFKAVRIIDVLSLRRVAAAWNAAHDAGLSTETLEAGVVKELIKASRAALLCLRSSAFNLSESKSQNSKRSARIYGDVARELEAVLAMIGEGK